MSASARPAPDTSPLARRFRFAERGTNLRTELLGGLTTFFVMAYIIFLNPTILTLNNDAGAQAAGAVPPFTALVTATCLAAGLMTLAMGLFTNYPFALASGLGLNAVVAFELIATRRLPWPAAMGIVFMEGVIITLLVLTGFRQAVLEAVPLVLKRSISVGIGLFILFIGLVSAGFVQRTPFEGGTPLTLGNFAALPILTSLFGLLFTLALMARGVKTALLAGIVITTVVATIVRALTNAPVSVVPTAANVSSLANLPPINFDTIGAGFNFSAFNSPGGVAAGIGILATVLVIFSLMLSDFFDTMGTIVGVGEQGGFVDEQGRLPGSDRVLLVDSLAAAVGGLFGVSSVTTYIESAAGVGEGARTGLASVVTGVLFLLAIVIAPLAGIVPPEATAPALIIVGFLMFAAVRELPVTDLLDGFPALITLIMMPLTYSITNGIGAGFLTYVFLRLVTGRAREVKPLLWLIAVAFLVYFLLPVLEQQFGV